jgi:hypothetical protein
MVHQVVALGLRQDAQQGLAHGRRHQGDARADVEAQGDVGAAAARLHVDHAEAVARAQRDGGLRMFGQFFHQGRAILRTSRFDSMR